MFSKYGIIGFIRHFISYVYSKIFFPGSRLIRLPFDIRNSRFIKIGTGFTTGFGCRIEVVPLDTFNRHRIVIGKNVQINDYVHIAAVDFVLIGDNVLIASKVYISDHNHGSYNNELSSSPLTIPIERECVSNPVTIENNVWIGESVCILPGVRIGEGSIIGAMSVVTKNVPPFSIAAGNPARIIKKYNFDTKKWETV
jgi:acetyltransferase-like isoleucine patch superfamily enzyme